MEPSLTELRLRNTEAKLARLLEAAGDALAFLRPVENGFPRNAHCARAKLREAIEEAKS